MNSKQRPLHNKSRTKYWGALAPNVIHRILIKPRHFMSLIQAQYQHHRALIKDESRKPATIL